GASDTAGNILFDTNSTSDDIFGRVITTELDPDYGLVTGFVETSAATTPEPTTFALLGVGLIGLEITRRRNRKA
ncbi:MAG: PEP-CTERM sorting domain-containing protein, partial [Bryobacteraceae bacterium]